MASHSSSAHLVAHFQQVDELTRGLGGIGSPAGHLLKRLDRASRIHTDGVAGELGRGEYLEVLGNPAGGAVPGVFGDDRPSTTDHGGGQDVLVVGVRQAVAAVQRFPAGDDRVREVAPHLLDQVIGLRLGLRAGRSSLHPLIGLVMVQLGEDRLAPQRPVQALDRE
jgi:hypothetical protein